MSTATTRAIKMPKPLCDEDGHRHEKQKDWSPIVGTFFKAIEWHMMQPRTGVTPAAMGEEGRV